MAICSAKADTKKTKNTGKGLIKSVYFDALLLAFVGWMDGRAHGRHKNERTNKRGPRCGFGWKSSL